MVQVSLQSLIVNLLFLRTNTIVYFSGHFKSIGINFGECNVFTICNMFSGVTNVT